MRRASITISFFLFFCFSLGCATRLSAETLREPWPSKRSPVNDLANVVEDVPLFGNGETFFNSACFIWLKFYQDFLSLFNTVRCPMHPSCSNYSVQAVRKHGAIIGVVMTADRLLHEADEQRTAVEVRVGGRRKYLDTVENNDFWWSKK